MRHYRAYNSRKLLLLTSGLTFFILMILTIGCTEVYVPDLNAGGNILYVEGGITDVAGPHTVNLRYTAGYNDNPEFNPATGARLSIWEDNNYLCDLPEISEGTYQTDSFFRAVRGRSYKLFIETDDGQVYESKPQELPLYNYPLDSVYGLAEYQKIKYYNVFGELIVFNETVNQLYANIPAAPENTYYRFESQLILEHAAGMRAYVTSEYDPLDLYMWNSIFPQDLSVIEVNSQRDYLNKFRLTHALEDNESYSQMKYSYHPAIQARYDLRVRQIIPVNIETDTGNYTIDSIVYGIPVEITEMDYYYGWIIRVHQYSITQDAYTFWTDVKKLEETEGEIFDPISTQLRGNLSCTTDPERPILGLFEVASQIETDAFVNYTSLNGVYLGKLLHDFPEFSDNGWHDTIPPPFWINKVF